MRSITYMALPLLTGDYRNKLIKLGNDCIVLSKVFKKNTTKQNEAKWNESIAVLDAYVAELRMLVGESVTREEFYEQPRHA